MYNDQLIEIIRTSRNQVVFLDKNHPVNGGVETVTRLIDQNIPPNVDYQKIYLKPEITSQLV